MYYLLLMIFVSERSSAVLQRQFLIDHHPSWEVASWEVA